MHFVNWLLFWIRCLLNDSWKSLGYRKRMASINKIEVCNRRSFSSTVSVSKNNLFRLALFLNDNLGDCFKESITKTLYYFTPCLVIIAQYFLFGVMESSTLERSVVILLFNFTIANITLHLMLTNMTKKPFTLLQPAYIYTLLPVIFHFSGAETSLIILLTRFCAVGALLNFCLDMFILSK